MIDRQKKPDVCEGHDVFIQLSRCSGIHLEVKFAGRAGVGSDFIVSLF